MTKRYTQDGKHEIVFDQQWEDYKAWRKIVDWNNALPKQTIDDIPWAKGSKRPTGEPSNVIEKRTGTVT